MTEGEQAAWFEGVWAAREERLYRSFFGDPVEGRIHTLTEPLFASLGEHELDPRWLTHGVIEFAPTARRASSLFVTSGLSNPWGMDPSDANPFEPSGLGFELLMEAPAGRGGWAVGLLQWLSAVQLLVATGRMEGGLLEPGDRIPLGEVTAKAHGSALFGLLAAEPVGFPAQFELPSGMVQLTLLCGVTEREYGFAERVGPEQLVTKLKHAGYFPVTDPERRELDGL